MASLGKIRRCEMQIKLICTKCVPDNYKNVIGEIKMCNGNAGFNCLTNVKWNIPTNVIWCEKYVKFIGWNNVKCDLK